MQHYGYHDNKKHLLTRLKRAEGQIRGIARMVEDDKYCIDVLTQISAAEAALNKVALELVRGHTRHCMSDVSLSDEDKKAKVDELVSAVGRLLAK
jgi:DNA-binding FrmR family transcriptional regulator